MDSYYMGEVFAEAAVQADLLLVQTAVMTGVEAGTQTDAALAAAETVLFKDEAVATDEASHEMGVITPGGRHGEELCEELCSLEQTYEEAEQVLVDEAGQVIAEGVVVDIGLEGFEAQAGALEELRQAMHARDIASLLSAVSRVEAKQ